MKKLFTIAIMALSINAFAQIPTNGLVGYWPFNGNANDESGNGNNGTVNGATLTVDRFGNANNSYSFNGVNNYISIPNSTLFNFDKFTISLWIRISNYTKPEGDVFIFNNGDDVKGSSWRIYHQGVIPTDSASLVNDIFTPSRFINYHPISSGKWHNVIFIYDNSQIKTFIDGGLTGSRSTFGSILNTNSDIMIGARQQFSSVTGFYNGIIDDIRIYNRALTQSELSAMYNGNICFQSVTVTDTLVINANFTGFNPVTYANTIKVYPNPTKDKITIDCGNNFNTINGYTIKITNSLSQAVYTSKLIQQSATIDLSTWTGRGIYFVHLIDGNGNTIDIKKIVLQ